MRELDKDKLKDQVGLTTETNKTIPARAYSMVISAYLETADYGPARELINTLENSNMSLDSSVYETFITALGFAGGRGKGGTTDKDSVEEVTRMVAHMKERGLEPSTNTYKQLLNNLINQNKTEKAVELLQSLCETKKELHVDLFTMVIRAYYSNEEPTKALQVVELMKQVGVLPNEYLATALVFCLVRAKQFNTAWDIVAWVKTAGLDIIGLGDIIQAAQKKHALAK